MGWMLIFFGIACLAAAVIAAAFWDYRTQEEKARDSRDEFKNATSTTMNSGKTTHIIITYKRDEP